MLARSNRKQIMNPLEIGVCGWSIDRHDAVQGIQYAAKELKLSLVQIGFFTERAVKEAAPEMILRAAQEAGVEIVSPFLAFEKEDYSTIQRIAETGGYGFDEQYEARLALTGDVARIAEAMGCDSISVHAGTIPADRAQAMYGRLLGRVREVADMLADHKLALLIETGREPADVLARFIEEVDRTNVGVSFDAGNFVIYGTDDPAKSVAKLQRFVRNVHMKDAGASSQPGVAYGGPASLGAGDAQIPRVLNKLRATGYAGPVMVEANTRALGMEALKRGIDYLRSMLV
jgi:sugar phosphate isomerase/epimerase